MLKDKTRTKEQKPGSVSGKLSDIQHPAIRCLLGGVQAEPHPKFKHRAWDPSKTN